MHWYGITSADVFPLSSFPQSGQNCELYSDLYLQNLQRYFLSSSKDAVLPCVIITIKKVKNVSIALSIFLVILFFLNKPSAEAMMKIAIKINIPRIQLETMIYVLSKKGQLHISSVLSAYFKQCSSDLPERTVFTCFHQ